MSIVTIHRAFGLSFVIFADDHDPADVHVFGDGQAKINLIGRDDRPELVSADRMTCSDVRHAMSIITAQRDTFLARWRTLHG